MIGLVGLVDLILGIGLLVAGRKLFWLFIGAAGFVLGAQIVIRSFHGPEWLGLVIGILVGLLFAGLAVFLRTLAIGLAGFVAGASILAGLVDVFHINVGGMGWLIYLVGGVIGIILVSLLFNWALILLSSMGGAALLVREAADAGLLQAALAGVVFVVLVIFGIVIQGTALRRERKHG